MIEDQEALWTGTVEMIARILVTAECVIGENPLVESVACSEERYADFVLRRSKLTTRIMIC